MKAHSSRLKDDRKIKGFFTNFILMGGKKTFKHTDKKLLLPLKLSWGDRSQNFIICCHCIFRYEFLYSLKIGTVEWRFRNYLKKKLYVISHRYQDFLRATLAETWKIPFLVFLPRWKEFAFIFSIKFWNRVKVGIHDCDRAGAASGYWIGVTQFQSNCRHSCPVCVQVRVY